MTTREAEREILKMSNNLDYSIEILTGSGRHSGTDADIFITLEGSDNQIANVQLINSTTNKDPFESGQKDIFLIKSPNLGNIQKVTLRCVQRGKGASWFVKYVKVKNPKAKSSAKEFQFQFEQWFSKRSGWEHSSYQLLSVSSLTFDKDYTENQHTQKYKSLSGSRVILRRGNSVKLHLSFKRPYTENDEDFQIVFSTGSRPRESERTMGVARRYDTNFHEKLKRGKWAYKVVEINGTEMTVEVSLSWKAIAGSYKLTIEEGNGDVIYEFDGDIILLYNPWCERDEVYMRDKDHIREYVSRQNGIVYQGSGRFPIPKMWYFGQFEAVVLDVVLYLLDKLPTKKRRTVVDITRAFSSLCNSFDNDGILEGNWSGDYSDGRSPSFWTTTPAILKSYTDNGYKPVKYGQCWVFSALFNALMRCLGIPCRPVTNFSSAHDTDANVTNDLYFNTDGEPIEDMNNDSVWNFHVWNDVWTRRDDLRSDDTDNEYDGWQAVDATPQELSAGLYQMGPCPLKAVKEGCVDKKYDAKFVFAEVNAETVYWVVDEEGKTPRPVKRMTNQVGRFISTKAIGSNARNDITHEYKFMDGTIFESVAVRNAMELCDHPMTVDESEQVPVLTVSIHEEKQEYHSGEDIVLQLHVKNNSEEDHSILVNGRADLVRYTGKHTGRVAEEKRKISVQKGKEMTIGMTIATKDYIHYMKGDESIKVNLSAVVTGTRHMATTEETIELLKPEISIKVLNEGTIYSGEEMEVELSFTNPLDAPLMECRTYFGGSILEETEDDFTIGEIPAKEKFVKKYKLSPMQVNGHHKKKSLLASVWCRPIGGFSEHVRVYVSDK